MPPDNSTPAPTSATITITRYPAGEFRSRVYDIANRAKHGAWASGGTVLPDHMFIRAALLVEHLRRLREPMNEAAHVAGLIAMSFEETDETREAPERVALLSMVLDDPSRVIAGAVANNRRLAGLPPQLDLVPDPEPS